MIKFFMFILGIWCSFQKDIFTGQPRRTAAWERTPAMWFTSPKLFSDSCSAKLKLVNCCPFLPHTKVVHLTVAQQNFIESPLRSWQTSTANHQPGGELYQRVLLTELLLFSNRLNFDLVYHHLNELNPVYLTIHKIVQHVRKNYREKLTLTAIANEFYISPYYLSRMFKQVTGLTLTEYLNNTRIKAAQQLLRTTDLPISAISEQVGYESHSHFGRVFRKFTSCSPMQYRKTHRTAKAENLSL